VYYVAWIVTVAGLAAAMRSKASQGVESEAKLPLAEARQQASQNNRVRGFLWGALAGSIAGNAFMTKVASNILATDPHPFANGYLYLFSSLTIAIHLGALGMLYFGLRRYEALLLITTVDAFNILVGAVSGSVVLQEIVGRSGWLAAVFVLSVLIVLLGLITLVVYWPATLCGGRDCFGPGDADACDGIRKKPREPTGAWDDFIDAKDPSHGPMGRE